MAGTNARQTAAVPSAGRDRKAANSKKTMNIHPLKNMFHSLALGLLTATLLLTATTPTARAQEAGDYDEDDVVFSRSFTIASLKTAMRFENLSATPNPVRLGQRITLTAQLGYLDRPGSFPRRWHPLNDKPSLVEFTISGRTVATDQVNVGENGIASITFTVTEAIIGNVGSRGKSVSWYAKFRGAPTLSATSKRGTFTVNR